MLLLRSKRIFKRLLELDPITGSHRELESPGNIGEPVKINGFFDNLNGVLTAIYVYSGQLFLMAGGKVINITERVDVAVSGPVGARQLRVSNENGELMVVTYSVDNAKKFENDPTPFVESEDFDFGLFVSNIAASAERRSVVLEVW